MKVHPMIANPSTIKPGKWNESESSLNEFAFSAIALDEMKKMMKNIVINSVCERRCNPPKPLVICLVSLENIHCLKI